MQFFFYLIVGGLSFLVELTTFIALRAAATAVIPASVASSVVATVANYLLSVTLAFVPGRFRRQAELARFLVVVLIGLGLNTTAVWLFAYPLAIPPVAAKIGAVPIVLIWNYLGRRLLVFDARVPAGVRALIETAVRPRRAITWRLRSVARRSGRFARCRPYDRQLITDKTPVPPVKSTPESRSRSRFKKLGKTDISYSAAPSGAAVRPHCYGPAALPFGGEGRNRFPVEINHYRKLTHGNAHGSIDFLLRNARNLGRVPDAIRSDVVGDFDDWARGIQDISSVFTSTGMGHVGRLSRILRKNPKWRYFDMVESTQ